MQIHHDISDLPAFRNSVVTFGSFDGVHIGHASIVEKMKALAEEIGGETVIVTFHPHPRQVIYPADKSLRLLSTKTEKIRHFQEINVDHLVFCPFSIEFSQWSPDEYIENFILKKFRPKKVVIGYDHRFGLNRAGNIDFLRSYQNTGGFDVVELPQQLTEQIEISSTKIRKFIQDGNIKLANQLLGHPYLVSGKVVRGQQIGEKLGFPTANIEVESPLKLIPPEGIYAVNVSHGSRTYGGMLYIGTRPTVVKNGRTAIEVNIFNFTEDIYDEYLSIEVLEYLRPDKTFENLEGLRVQLEEDKRQALEFLRMSKPAEPEATVIILNYNGRDHLENFLPSVLRFSDKIPIVVADNGSTDDSTLFLKDKYPSVEILQLAKNFGFAGGYNEAISKIKSKYIILLNSDVEVTSGWAEKLLDFMRQRPDVAVVQPKIKSYDHKNLFEYAGAAGGLMDKLGYPFCQGRILSEVEDDLGQYDIGPNEIFWATGAAMVIEKELFENVGGFDRTFFAHMEEIDLCWRLKKIGYKIFCLPSSVVYHKGGGTLSYSSPRKTYLNFRNGMSLLIKNEKFYNLLWLLPTRVTLDLIAGLRFVMIGEYANAKSVIRSITYIFLNFPSIWSKRKSMSTIISNLRTGSDNSIAGRYEGSIIWEFFVMGRKKYNELRYVANKYT